MLRGPASSARTIPALSLALSLSALIPSSAADAARPVAAIIIGQSNEAGAGATTASGLTLAAQQDPIPPHGGPRSMWPLLEEYAARRGVRIVVWNSAVGATSLVHSWAGSLDAWRAGQTVIRGSYALADGQVFKCVALPGSAPLAVSRSRPGQTGGADGVTWQRVGPARPIDRPGQVYAPGDPLFDPNGYVAGALAGFIHLPSGERWTLISIGQGDAGDYWAVTREQYRRALVAVTRAALAKGSKVAIGFTVFDDNPAAERNYQTQLLPGRRDALADFARDPRVIAGANLRAALGRLPSDARAGKPGLVAHIHMDDAAYTLASRAWFDALRRAGWLR